MRFTYRNLILSCLLVSALLTACNNKAPKETEETMDTMPTDTPNMLSEAEKNEGFELLFDGKTLDGWHGFQKDTLSPDWKVEDGAITLDMAYNPDSSRQYASLQSDLVTDQDFGDFELQMEWKISPCGNSGIIYRSVEEEKYHATYVTGPEMQVLDDDCHPDGKIEKHRSSDLYDLVTANPRPVKPVGEWNQVKLVAKGNHIEHWLNGEKVVDIEMGTDEWNKMVQNSKWKEHAEYFAKAKKGHIALQDHGNRVWFRNIKIRKIEG